MKTARFIPAGQTIPLPSREMSGCRAITMFGLDGTIIVTTTRLFLGIPALRKYLSRLDIHGTTTTRCGTTRNLQNRMHLMEAIQENASPVIPMVGGLYMVRNRRVRPQFATTMNRAILNGGAMKPINPIKTRLAKTISITSIICRRV